MIAFVDCGQERDARPAVPIAEQYETLKDGREFSQGRALTASTLRKYSSLKFELAHKMQNF
jgi:hypothetical protein